MDELVTECVTGVSDLRHSHSPRQRKIRRNKSALLFLMALLTSSGPFLTHAANGSPTVCKSHTHNFVKRGRGLLFEHLQACKKKLETLERPHAIAILHESGFRKAASYRYLLIIVLSNTSAAYGQVWETKRLPAFSAPATWNRFKSQLKLNNSASQGFWKLHGNGFLRR